ncbi:hypothetical protein ACE1CI_24010 [Aerosakkonemataceae cyanobacterium BLCC-F50]|uniref:Uncharacterized protein n=1 Tax=Floridaenema flaviceps BLCC-F50 TaxID=3153642 RepID=A0ABV4XWD6_9CYAN
MEFLAYIHMTLEYEKSLPYQSHHDLSRGQRQSKNPPKKDD